MNKYNIYDISKKAGVSIATVSRVLNNSEKVSDATRQKVLAVIAKADYTPNIFARSLLGNSMNTIGVLCANISDIYIAEAINRISNGLRENGYDSLLCCTGYNNNDKKAYLSTLLTKGVDAVIFVGSDFINTKENDYIIDAGKKVPIFIVNGYINRKNIYGILCDDEGIVAETTTHFLRKGIKDILFINRRRSYGSEQKLKGFKSAYREMGINFDSKNVVYLDKDTSYITENLHELSRVEAVITGDDELAIGCLKYAKMHGIAVPDKLQVIGYNNSRLCELCEPELSSIDNNLSHCCDGAVRTLVNVLKNQPTPRKTIVSGELHVRQTTKEV